MSTPELQNTTPPLAVGAMLRFVLQDIRERIYDGVVAAGFEDLRPSHVTLFRWPGPDGMRPTELADTVQMSKQAVNDLVRHLERCRYLELRPDPQDNRARLIHLTDRGRRLHRVAVGIHAQIEDEWTRTVGRRRFEQLCKTLKQLMQSAEHRAQVASTEA